MQSMFALWSQILLEVDWSRKRDCRPWVARMSRSKAEQQGYIEEGCNIQIGSPVGSSHTETRSNIVDQQHELLGLELV